MLDQISRLIPGFDWAYLLVYLRLQACILTLPAFGERFVGPRIKIAIAVAMTPLMRELTAVDPIFDTPTDLFPLALPELAIGFAMGALVRIMSIAIDIAATAIAMTASLSQLIGGMNDASPHPIGNLFHLGALAVLFALGLPSMLVDLIADSFSVWPIGELPDIEGLARNAVGFVARSFGFALMLASPFIIGGFLFQALSGVVSKVMPALPVVFIGAPAAILLALLGLAVIAPMIVGLWADAILDLTLPRAG